MTERLVQSIPTPDLQSYYDCGWAYIMPDFDQHNHSWVEWLSEKMPVYPHRVPSDTGARESV